MKRGDMAFVLNPTRKVTIKYEDKESGDSFEADFDFILTEDCFTEEMRKRVLELKPILKEDNDEIKTQKIYKQQSVMWYKIRKSLKEVRGIQDVEGNDIIITEENQGAVFEFICDFGDIAVQAYNAYLGLHSKNLNAGVTK